jgi:transcriptional regulator with XRE-family HTH domain
MVTQVTIYYNKVTEMSIPITKQNRICYTGLVNNFKEFIERQYLDWQSKSGKRKTLNEFADHLEVKRPLLSLWMSGDRKPGRETILRLAELFGPEIYDALEMPRPDPRLHYVSKHWKDTPKNIQKKITEEIQRYTTEEAPNDE